MVQIDYYFTFMSPFTYLAGTRLETVAARHGAAIRYKPMDIGAVFGATGGVPLKDRHASRLAYRLQEIRRVAKRAEAPINAKPAHLPTNLAPASHAIIAAQEAGFSVGLAAHGLLKAAWAEERDLADPAVIDGVLAEHGVSSAAIEPHLAAAEATFQKNTEEAIANGVFGSPFYIVGDERFWGQDRLDYLDAHLAEAAA